MSTTQALPKAAAMTAYKAICDVLGTEPHPEPVRQGHGLPASVQDAGPLLYRDYEGWHSTTAWAVVWEGQGEWVHSSRIARNTEEIGIYAEPVNGYTLGLYPMEDARDLFDPYAD